MVISNAQGLSANLNKTYAVSQRSNWQDLSALTITSVDTTNLTNPSALITSKLTTAPDTNPATSRVVLCDPGTNLILRLRYPSAGVSGITNPVVKVIGVDKVGKYHTLLNLSAAQNVTLTTNQSTDMRDGTYNYTDVVGGTIVDLQGSTYFIVVVSTALAATGSLTGSLLQYKIV